MPKSQRLGVNDFTHFREISPVRKRLVILFILIVGVILIGTPLTFAQRAYYRNIESSWNEVVSQSGILGANVTLLTNEQKVRDMSDQLDQTQKIITDQELFLNKLNQRYFMVIQNKQALTTLNYYQQYLDTLKTLVQNPVTFTDLELNSAKDKSRLLQSSVNILLTNSKLKTQLPSQLYILPDKIKEVRDQYEKNQKLEAEQKSAAAARQFQQEADESEVVRHVIKFMDAYIAGDANEIKRYMTDAYINEFDFNQLSTDYRKYSKPENFRITDTKRETDAKYAVTGMLVTVYSYQNGNNKSSQAMTLRVVRDAKYNFWLVDGMSYGSGE